MDGLEVSLSKQRTSSVLHQLGMEARRNFKVATMPAAASLQLDWIHSYDNGGRVLNMALAGDSTTTTSVMDYQFLCAPGTPARLGAFSAQSAARTMPQAFV